MSSFSFLPLSLTKNRQAFIYLVNIVKSGIANQLIGWTSSYKLDLL